LIDVCTAERMSRARLLSILPHAIRGAHVSKRGIELYRGESVTISADSPFPIHIDGEYLGRRDTPLELRIVKRVLPVLCLRGGRTLESQPLERLLP
jgi:diacylglycerol kinase family enzyme